MKIDQEKLTKLVYNGIFNMFEDNDPNLINPDFLNDPRTIGKVQQFKNQIKTNTLP